METKSMASILNIFAMIILVILIVNIPVIILAKDLGVRGQLFAINEEGFIEMIKRKLAKINVEDHQREIESIVRRQVLYPQCLQPLARTVEARKFYYDPTYILDRDAILPDGKILHRAGTKVNPLDQMSLDRRLFFINANDQEQVEWLQVQLTENIEIQVKNRLENRVILIDGSVLKLEQQLIDLMDSESKISKSKILKSEVSDSIRGIIKHIYFDQKSELVDRFGINNVPAIAVQEGNRIRIDEIVM